nr:DNA-directed DNA polymerase [Tanacetum cinerariifolium]
MSDIKGITPSYYTHKILIKDDFKLVIQPERRLNSKVQDVVKNEIVKLVYFGLIYPISDSLWVSPIHVVPKKGGMTVVLNDDNELIPSRTVTGWRDFCLQKDAFWVMERSSYLLKMHDDNLDRMLARCGETNLVLNWEKYHFMIKEGIVLGHQISGARIEVDRAKIDDAKPRLIRWVLLLQGFEIKDKRGAENLAADHLSRLENPELSTFMKEEIADEFLDEHLMALKIEINNDEPCASVTERKVYESGFFWPSIFKDAKDYVMRCDACQRSEMP